MAPDSMPGAAIAYRIFAWLLRKHVCYTLVGNYDFLKSNAIFRFCSRFLVALVRSIKLYNTQAVLPVVLFYKHQSISNATLHSDWKIMLYKIVRIDLYKIVPFHTLSSEYCFQSYVFFSCILCSL